MKRVSRILLVALAAACFSTGAVARDVTAQEARAIAKEAYLYGYSIVDNWKAMYAFFYDPTNRLYKAPPNTLYCEANVYTPADTAIVTPNSDTPYCYVLMDLRAQPIVLQIPEVPSSRYYSVQLIDLYTYNFGYMGSRATGGKAGKYLVVGPSWKGAAPAGIAKVFRADTDIVMAVYRTQLFGAADLPNVKDVQKGYKVETLAELTGGINPPPPPKVDVPPYDPVKVKSPTYFQYLNELLQYAPALPNETALRARFAKIGVVPGKPFDFSAFAAAAQAAIEVGMAEGLKGIEAKAATATDASGFLGSREFLNDRSGLKRAVGALLGIYGNSKEEAFYRVYQNDAAGQPLNGEIDYTLHFAAGKLPPVDAFWSITMYDGKTKLLVANPLDRYLINSPMLPDLKRDPDGGVTIYLQHASPGKEKESNWLPAPAGPMYLAMRLYWPKQSVLDGKWIVPKIQKAK